MKQNNDQEPSTTLLKKPKVDSKTLTTMALLTACNVVLNDYFALNTEFFKINFGFVSVILTAVLFGPWGAVTVAMLGDVIGLVLFPPAGAPNPIFTILAGMTGLIYGLCLYSKKKEISDKSLLIRSGIAAFLVTQIMYTVMNTLVLSYLYGSVYVVVSDTGVSFTPVMWLRVYKNVVLFFVNMMIIPVVFEAKKRLEKSNLLAFSRKTV